MKEKVFKVLIVDDEQEACLLLRSLLSEIKNVEVVGEAYNVEKALYLLVEHYPDLILLDINMPGKTGMELMKLIRSRNIDVPVVFITAFEEYTVEAIRHGIYDLLLKPVDPEELYHVIEKYKRMGNKDLPSQLMQMLNSIRENSKIKINSNHSYVLINPLEIIYCTSKDGYSHIYLSNGKTEISNTSMVMIEKKVKAFNFHRLGRSVLINLDYIRTVNKNTGSCTLKANNMSWEIQASNHSLKELLTNYA